MAEVKVNQPESLLSREQLKEVERFQARFGELERQLHHCVDDFLSVLNRHYFNRENGYLDEQQENLREIVTIQAKLESLASNMATGSAELKTRMLELQSNLQKQPGEKPAGQKAPDDKPKPKESAQEPEAEQPKQEKPKPKPAAPLGAAARGLIDREGGSLGDSGESGGEISLRLIFEGLRLTEPSNQDALNVISTQLRKLLYERKLVGYSKTSLVFGKNRTVAEVLEDLTPIFLSAQLMDIMVSSGLIDPGEGDLLVLGCTGKRELIYTSRK
jgi:hypothetical protein